MMSIDLSRAFDNVPRWALQMALSKSGASTDLQQVVLALHEKCRYQVRHKGYEGTFAMKKGVRQGCALSPYLYALFTCLIFDVLAECTCQAWATAAMTGPFLRMTHTWPGTSGGSRIWLLSPDVSSKHFGSLRSLG